MYRLTAIIEEGFVSTVVTCQAVVYRSILSTDVLNIGYYCSFSFSHPAGEYCCLHLGQVSEFRDYRPSKCHFSFHPRQLDLVITNEQNDDVKASWEN